MNRTSIEWIVNPDGSRPGWSWSPITGCLNHVNGLCKGGGFPCYAYKLANTRLKQRYLANPDVAPRFEDDGSRFNRYEDLHDPFYPRFWEERLNEPYTYGRNFSDSGYKTQAHKRIFVCDMGELFGDWIPKEWQEKIFYVIKSCSQHRFYLLTKQPQNLIKFSPFPENCFVGGTCTNFSSLYYATPYLAGIEAKVKFISFEPLLQSMKGDCLNLIMEIARWLIIGACTGTVKEMSHLVDKYPQLTPMPYGKIWTAQPKIEWLREIVEAADKAGAKVFLKNNLKPSLVTESDGSEYAPRWANGGHGTLRQEMPELQG